MEQQSVVRLEFERLGLAGEDMMLRSKAIESLVLTKVLKFLRTDKYEMD